MNRKAPEQFKIRSVQSNNRLDPRDMKSRGHNRIEQSFATEVVLPHPGQELRRCGSVRKELYRLRGVPQPFGTVDGNGHAQRIGTAPRISHDVDKLGKNLGNDGELLAVLEKPVAQTSRIGVTPVRDELHRHKERSVNSVNHPASPPEGRLRWSAAETGRHPRAAVTTNSAVAGNQRLLA